MEASIALPLRSGLPAGPRDEEQGGSTPANRTDVLVWLSALSLLGLGHPLRLARRAQEEATIAASGWLGLVDAGLHDRSWDEAAPVLRLGVSRDTWRTAVRAARERRGTCVSRRLLSRVPVQAPPEAPLGSYVVMRFVAAFEGGTDAVETVTSVRGSDGRWRVAAYFIS
jgi:Protein of unknown function (DUF4019)